MHCILFEIFVKKSAIKTESKAPLIPLPIPLPIKPESLPQKSNKDELKEAYEANFSDENQSDDDFEEMSSEVVNTETVEFGSYFNPNGPFLERFLLL